MSVSIEKAVVARITVSGQRFEILVDPNKAMDLKSGKDMTMDDTLAYPVIYRDVRTTETVADTELQKTFGTTNVYKIAEVILKQGEIQLTTEQRREMVEQKRNQIVSLISKRGINPQTNTPHPEQRILNAMHQAGVNIDTFQPAELQLEKVVNAIKKYIPLKFQNVTLQVKVPAQFSGRAFPIIKTGKVINEQWLNDGSLQATVEIMAGVMDEFIQKISNLTHGNFESKVLKREDV